ncbi:MAG: condensation domain-containing protein, partial [Gammaproteobacteria bacterium]|nr:condensation domain-containing protein [Gammaproteobacteria bacterium]
MSVDELLTKLRSVDVNLVLEGDELRVSAPKGALDAELRDQLSNNKAAIIKALGSAKRTTTLSAQPIERLKPSPDYPVSFAQERLWFLDQLEPGKAFYNMPLAIRLHGELSIPALGRTLNAIVSRHQTLRTRFASRNGRPIQVIDEDSKFELLQEDLSAMQAGTRDTQLALRIRQESLLPFDLAHDSLVRGKLLRLSERDHVLLFTMHHIISDGWSMGVLFRELGACYAAFS